LAEITGIDKGDVNSKKDITRKPLEEHVTSSIIRQPDAEENKSI
jgi:hypothetical protein